MTTTPPSRAEGGRGMTHHVPAPEVRQAQARAARKHLSPMNANERSDLLVTALFGSARR